MHEARSQVDNERMPDLREDIPLIVDMLDLLQPDHIRLLEHLEREIDRLPTRGRRGGRKAQADKEHAAKGTRACWMRGRRVRFRLHGTSHERVEGTLTERLDAFVCIQGHLRQALEHLLAG